MKRGKCVYNKKELKKVKYCICYYCLDSFRKEEIKSKNSEELTCPNCKMSSIIAVNDLDKITKYWAAKLSSVVYD